MLNNFIDSMNYLHFRLFYNLNNKVSWCDVIVCFFPIYCTWLRYMLHWLNWILCRLIFYSFYWWKIYLDIFIFLVEESEYAKNSLWKSGFVVNIIIIFTAIIFVILFTDTSRYINILSSVFLKQQKQKQYLYQPANIILSFKLQLREHTCTLKLKCVFLTVLLLFSICETDCFWSIHFLN